MRYLLLFTFFSIGSNVSGQLELQNWLGISFEEAQKKAGTISDVFTHVRSDLKLPISKSRGGQLICEKFKLSPDLILDKVAFIFFNNKLTLIQSKDPKLSIAIKKKQNVKPLDYGGYLIYPEEVIAISKKDKRVSIFNKEHLHVHLFLWENPELRTEIKRIPRAVDLLKMKLGETQASIMTQFSPRSQLINKNKATDSSRASKFTQINCFGYNYFGFPRKVEFMMDAGKLAYLWILTDKVEEEELKKLLAAKTGGIEKETANYIWFSGGKVALRKDVPEVLVVADKYRDLFEY